MRQWGKGRTCHDLPRLEGLSVTNFTEKKVQRQSLMGDYFFFKLDCIQMYFDTLGGVMLFGKKLRP